MEKLKTHLPSVGKLSLKKETFRLSGEISAFLKKWTVSQTKIFHYSNTDQIQGAFDAFMQNLIHNYNIGFGWRTAYVAEKLRVEGVNVDQIGCMVPNTLIAMTMCAEELKAAAQKLVTP